MKLLKIKLLFSVALVFGFLGLAGGAEAATYYVRTNGSDSCNGTTDAGGSSGSCAFRTILKGIQTAQAGDTVTVHSGDYSGETLDSVRSGSSGSMIRIQAASGETVSISRIDFNHNYNVVSGFRMTGPGGYNSGAVQFNGDYNQAIGNTILGANRGDDGYGCGFGVAGDYNTISQNTLDGQNNGTNTSFTWGFHISGTHNEITYNTIKDTNSIERVFELYGSYNRIANNEVSNVQWTIGNTSHPDIIQVFGTGGSDHQTIENNYFHDFTGQLGNLGIDGNDAAWNNWVFRNNVFANITMELFVYFPIELYNNTFYRVTTTNTGTVFQTGYRNGAVKLRNNAFIACGTSVNNGWYSPGEDADYNFVANTATGGTKSGFSEAHGVNGGNPYLTSYADNCATSSCNFHIGANSALINKGVVVSGYTTDKDGNNRSGTWDIGAYEYGGTVASPSPSMPPTSPSPTTSPSPSSSPGTATSIWSSSDTPAIISDEDPAAVVLGVKFRSDVAGRITGLKFYKGSQNTGTHTGRLWSSSGTSLGSLTFSNETSSGWQTASFSTPINISAGTTYIASYYAPAGHYSATNNYFTSTGKDNSPLHALRSGVDGTNGVYIYGSSSSFPNQSYQDTNYWVDVVFSPNTTTSPSPSTSPSTSPSQTCDQIGKGIANDVNTFNTLDVTTLEKIYLGLATGTGVDVNGSGSFSFSDVISLSQCLACIWNWPNCGM